MKIKHWMINVSFVIVGIFFIASIFYFSQGSLEMFPTEEQPEKARLGALLLMIIFAVAELLLVIAKIKLKRRL